MSCFLVRRQLVLFESDDLSVAAKRSVARHLEHCTDCRPELRRVSEAADIVRSFSTNSGSPELSDFSEGVMARIEGRPDGTPRFVSSRNETVTWMSPVQRYALAAMMLILSTSALLRYAFMDEMLTTDELQRSVVTRDGRIVSDAKLNGRDAQVTVVQDDAGMVIIWLGSAYKGEGSLTRG